MERPLEHSELERIRGAVARELPSFLADLEHLVNIDSGTYTKAGVDVIADWVTARLAALGAVVERHPHAELGDALVGTFEGAIGGPTILLIGHMDTVFGEGTTGERPFESVDGRAHGPGVGDMKSGLLGGLYAIAALRTLETPTEPLLRGKVIFVANADEEIGSPSSKALIEQLSGAADVALVLEGARPNGDLVTSRKGMMHARITLRGRAAHAGVEPEKGRSAILEAAHKVVALHELNQRWDDVTVNVGVIEGGARPNIVADTAQLVLDLRAWHRSTMELAAREIRRIVERTTVPDVVSSIETLSQCWPMEKGAQTQGLVDRAAALGAELGFEVAGAATGGASDGNTTAAAGVPTLDGLGPVSGGVHAPEEYIEIDSIVPRTALVAGLLVAVGRDTELTGRSRAARASTQPSR